MYPEIETPHRYDGEDQIAERMVGFAMSGPERGVQNFQLQEAKEDVPTSFQGVVGVFARDGRTEVTVLDEEIDANDTLPFYKAALNATLPQRVLDLKCLDNPVARQRSITILANRDYPYIMFGMGKIDGSDKTVAVLFVANGISPQTAIHELHDAINGKLGRRGS